MCSLVTLYRLVPLAATWIYYINYRNGYVGIVGTSLLPLLAYYQNIASLTLFYKNYFGRYSSGLAQLDSIPHSHGTSTRYSNWLLDFLSAFLDAIRMSM